MRKYRTCGLPRHLIVLVHKEHGAWRQAKKPSNFIKFRTIRNKLKTSIKQFFAESEKDLQCNDNRSAFYKYVNSRLGRSHSRPLL